MHSYPDLAYLIGVLSRFCSNRGPEYIKLFWHVLQYVSGTLQLGLKFDEETETQDDVLGSIDSHFARLKPDQKSTGDYVFMLAGVAISHSSNLQSIVSLLICESEYVAICEKVKEEVWLRYLLAELGF